MCIEIIKAYVKTQAKGTTAFHVHQRFNNIPFSEVRKHLMDLVSARQIVGVGGFFYGDIEKAHAQGWKGNPKDIEQLQKKCNELLLKVRELERENNQLHVVIDILEGRHT